MIGRIRGPGEVGRLARVPSPERCPRSVSSDSRPGVFSAHNDYPYPIPKEVAHARLQMH